MYVRIQFYSHLQYYKRKQKKHFRRTIMSMNTKDYKTKTMVVERDFPCRDNYWAVGLDIGYSAVKGISPAHYFCFPGIRKKDPRESSAAQGSC